MATRTDVLLICETWRDEAALEAHAASEPFVKNVAIINDCGEMKIEKFDMRETVKGNRKQHESSDAQWFVEP